MNPNELTGRQRSVLDMMSAGLQNKQIAHELGISPRTVEIHRAKAMRVVGARNTIHAALIWAAMKSRPPAEPGPATHNRPVFKVWFDGTKITRNGDFFADCATPEIAQALALALDSAQLLFDPAIPAAAQDHVAATLWPTTPATPAQPLDALLAADWEA